MSFSNQLCIRFPFKREIAYFVAVKRFAQRQSQTITHGIFNADQMTKVKGLTRCAFHCSVSCYLQESKWAHLSQTFEKIAAVIAFFFLLFCLLNVFSVYFFSLHVMSVLKYTMTVRKKHLTEQYSSTCALSLSNAKYCRYF